MLKEFNGISYEGLDNSKAMIEISEKKLSQFKGRYYLKCTDLRLSGWPLVITKRPDIILTHRSLHDLGNINDIIQVYGQAYKTLKAGGMFINADLVDRGSGGKKRSLGKITAERHIEILQTKGFTDIQRTLDMEYCICFTAYKPA